MASAAFLAVPCPPDVASLFPSFDWANASLSERALHLARSQERLKVREVGRNWGPKVSLYLRVANVFGPAPWCAAFVFWCLVLSGADRRLLWKWPASTWSLAVWARKEGRLKPSPARGRAFVWNSGSWTRSGSGHTGFCLEPAAADGSFTTIEGNTNAGGSREGVAVLERTRRTVLVARYPVNGYVSFEGLEV